MSRRLLLSYLLLTLFVLLVVEIPLGISYARNQRSNLSARLEHDATAVANSLRSLPRGRQLSKDDLKLLRTQQSDTGERYVVVDRDGAALFDSSNPSAPGRSFASRPEIKIALAGHHTASGIRYSNTLGYRILYVAVPVVRARKALGAVRVTYPAKPLDRQIRRFWLTLAAVAGMILAAAALVGLQFARSLTRPLERLEQTATEAGQGNLSVRADTGTGPPEIRSLAASFNHTVAKLESLLRSQQEFVADAAHQLRSPLAALQLGLENLERDVAAEGEGRLVTLQGETMRLSRLVDGLLTLARADAAIAPPGSVDLGPLVTQRLAAWDAYAAEYNVLLASRIGPDLGAHATPDRIEQVLDNLLANALNVSARGATITVTGRRAGRWVELHVVDEGPGMSEQDRAHAFDRLWRARRDRGGAGLGLSIVKRLVESDGGETELLTASSGGVDAVVRLRAADSMRGATAATGERRRATARA